MQHHVRHQHVLNHDGVWVGLVHHGGATSRWCVGRVGTSRWCVGRVGTSRWCYITMLRQQVLHHDGVWVGLVHHDGATSRCCDNKCYITMVCG